MAPVVKELAALPDQDIRAMAVYLARSTIAPRQAGQDALAARNSKPRTSTGVCRSSVGRADLSEGPAPLPRGWRRAAVRQPAALA